MAVREFDGTDDTIVHAIDALSGMTFGTTAAIFKPAATTGDVWVAAIHTSGNSVRAVNLGYNTDVGANRVRYEGANSPNSSIAAGTWFLVVARKATGTVTPRFSIYNFTGDTWTHDDGSTTVANWTSGGAGGFIRTDVETAFEFFEGRLAVRAMWTNDIHWSADATGDSQIEAAGLEVDLQSWFDESPTALWAFNQDPLSAVDDLIANCDQTSVVGTTVVTGDDPPGFTFDLTEPNLVPRVTVVAG